MSLSAEDILKLHQALNDPSIKDHVKIRKEFRNYMDSQINPDSYVIDIETEEALIQVLRLIQALNFSKSEKDVISARVVAGGRDENGDYSACFSATEITKADLNIRLTGDEFTNIERIADTNVVRVGGSVQMLELQKYIANKFGLVLPTASLIPYVTVAGLAATGGHGTGRDQPSFAGLLRGATIITANGVEVRLENNNPDFEVLMGAHLGVLGVIKDLDIECMPAKKLQNIVEKRSMADLFDAIREGLFLNNEYVSVLITPLYRKDELTNRELKNVAVIKQSPVPLATKNVDHCPLLDHLKQEVQVRLQQLVNVPEILREHDKLTPAYMQYLAAPASVGDEDEFSIGDWPTQWHFRTAYPHPDCGNDSTENSVLDEICPFIPVRDTAHGEAHGEEIINFLQEVYAKLREAAEYGDYPVNYAIFLRFLTGTRGGLSCTAVPAGNHVCAIDITTVGHAEGFDKLKEHVANLTLNEYHGNFHPGKNWIPGLDYRRIYGSQLDLFKAALERWNQKHHVRSDKNPLLNDLMREVLEYARPLPVARPAMQEVPANLGALKQTGMYRPVDQRHQRNEHEKNAKRKHGCCAIL